jgi:hypothetical protein
MCGIVAGFSKRKQRINKALMRRYREQKTRGTEGYGYLAMYPDRVSYVRRESEKEIELAIKQEMSHFIMLHHRMPTSTINVEECAHPIFVSHAELDYDYYVIHNGVIRNADELKKKHEGLGYKYTTVLEGVDRAYFKSPVSGREYFMTGKVRAEKYNDSEALAVEVARCIDSMTHTIDTIGTVAFIAMRVNKETGIAEKMYYGHNDGNPLFIENNKEYLWIKSQGGTALDTHKIFCYNIETGAITEQYQHIGRSFAVTPSKPMLNGYGNDTHRDYPYYHGKNNTVGKDELEDDIDYGDPSEHDYKNKHNNTVRNMDRKLGFDLDRDDTKPTNLMLSPIQVQDLSDDFQSTLNWKEDTGVANNDDVPYDYIMQDKRVRDLIERVLRLQRLSDNYSYAVDRCDDMASKPDADVDEIREMRDDAEDEIAKLEDRMTEIEADFYNMAEAHNGVDFYAMVDDYRKGISDEELDVFLGIKNKMSSITMDGRMF